MVSTDAGPFDPFEWCVDQYGYEMTSGGPSGSPLTWGVRGKGGPLRAYRLDLETATAGLFRQFAALQPSSEEILQFAGEYGCLVHKDGAAVERFTTWCFWIAQMNNLVVALDEGRNKDFWEKFNGAVGQGDPWEPLFAARIEPHAVPSRSKFKLVPTSLLAAMWLQLANSGTRGIIFKQCEFCPHWFPVGPGTGRKPSKRFCSDRCRVAWNRRRKAGDQHAR